MVEKESERAQARNGEWTLERTKEYPTYDCGCALSLSLSLPLSLLFLLLLHGVLRATSLEMEREGKEAGWLAGMGRGPDGRTTT